MPEVAQNLKSQTQLSSLVFTAEVANKSNLGQKCHEKQKLSWLVTLAKNDQDQAKLSPLISLAKNDTEKTKTFTICILGRKG